jgi:hypothetical protein
MTSLEIKRLDNSASSPTKSIKSINDNRNSNIIASNNGKDVEIPISIIKSSSFATKTDLEKELARSASPSRQASNRSVFKPDNSINDNNANQSSNNLNRSSTVINSNNVNNTSNIEDENALNDVRFNR